MHHQHLHAERAQLPQLSSLRKLKFGVRADEQITPQTCLKAALPPYLDAMASNLMFSLALTQQSVTYS